MSHVHLLGSHESDQVGDEPEQVDVSAVFGQDADVEIPRIRLTPADTAKHREQDDVVALTAAPSASSARR